MTPFNSHEFLSRLFSLLVVQALSLSLSLSLCLSLCLSSELPTPTLHSLLLFIASGWWRFHDYWSHSCVVGSNWLFLTRDMFYRNSGDGIGTGSSLQKIARQWYSPRQYQVVEDTGCSEQTHPRSIHNWLVWACLSCIQNKMDLLWGLGSILVFENVRAKAQGPVGLGSYPVQ